MKRAAFYTLLILLTGCSHPQAPAAAPMPKFDRTIGAWQIMIANPTKGETLCYAASAPVKSEGTIGPRGTAYLMATRRASGKIEISTTGGYSYMPGSKAELSVDDDTYRLFFKGGVAWSHNDAEDRQIIDAMQDDPEDIQVRGLSRTGLTSVDYYTPKGFTQAIERIRHLCP